MQKYIEKKLLEIEHIISNQLDYNNLENEKLELKDLSHGKNWEELYKTVCAFLNTNGGIIIIGVHENTKTKKLNFTGYNPHNEPNIKRISQQFTDKNKTSIDVSNYVRPDLMEIHPLCGGDVCVLFIEKLPEEKKYVYYKENAYERQLTGDHVISAEKIKKQVELIDELLSNKEMEIIENASIDDLDIDRLNDYIIRLNADKKIESLKADIQSAVQFLVWKRMIREGKPTMLGMLVCGKRHPMEYHLGERCELDAYFETGINKTIADDRKIYKETIIDLMESAWAFSFSKIGTGISVAGGGSAIFEYPEEIIRETINNALAHRDYTQNRFSTIIIRNNECIEIKNPGQFRQEQLYRMDTPVKIRRIIPIPKARNPNLADILKVYKRWEGRGIGMASLVNYALRNEIDVPYYIIHNQYEISLYVQKGKVLDERCELWLNSFSKYILEKTHGVALTVEQKTILAYIYKSETLNAHEKYTVNFSQSNNHYNIIHELEVYQLIYKLPNDKPELQLYGIDTILKTTNYNQKLQEIFGNALSKLNTDSIDILNLIYQYNQFSMVTEVSARLIGNYLFCYRNKRIENEKYFDDYKRKIRRLINKLEQSNFIKRDDDGKHNYIINTEYRKNIQPTLF
jgi:predicted HTH transcriptional regulator